MLLSLCLPFFRFLSFLLPSWAGWDGMNLAWRGFVSSGLARARYRMGWVGGCIVSFLRWLGFW